MPDNQALNYVTTNLFVGKASDFGAWSGATPAHTNLQHHQIMIVSSGVLTTGQYKVRFSVFEGENDLEATVDSGEVLAIAGKNSALAYFSGAIRGIHLEVDQALSGGETISCVLTSSALPLTLEPYIINAGLKRDSLTITAENPNAGDDISLFFTPRALTVTALRAVLTGSATPSVTWTIRHLATDRSGAGNEVVTGGTVTTSVTTGSDVTVFDDATIPANSFVWYETTAKSGTVDSISVTIMLTEDS